MGDLVERAFQRHPCDAPAAMFLVDIEAGNPQSLSPFARAPIVPAREFDAQQPLAAWPVDPPP
jgi:hypothetical protein